MTSDQILDMLRRYHDQVTFACSFCKSQIPHENGDNKLF